MSTQKGGKFADAGLPTPERNDSQAENYYRTA
jgi:hypothetical protein